MVIFENEYALIEHDQIHDIISLVWKKYTPGTFYREAMKLLFEALVTTGAEKSILDVSRLPTISHEDTQWTAEIAKTYYPNMRLSKSVIILKDNNFTKLALQKMNEEFKLTHPDRDTRINTRYFDDPEEARSWLISEDSVSPKDNAAP